VTTFPYAEVGATRDGPLPAGYDHVRRHVRLGAGRPVFLAAADALGRWEPQRGAGLRVRTDAPRAAVGVRFATGLGIGPVRLWAPCEVVWVVDEPTRCGFGFGTLAGHPEIGEEGFLVTLDEAETVWFDVRAFSRPGSRWVRLGVPLARRIQAHITDRYVAAIEAACQTR
jgi:uncharacterized protein (UPF0548 family)